MPKQVPAVPSAPAALGPYSIVTEAHGLVFISGQVAVDPATGTPVSGDVAAQTHQVLRNLGGILADLGLGFADVVKTTIFLADTADFPVVNEIYATYVGTPAPARSTIQAGALPGGFLIEIEAVAAR